MEKYSPNENDYCLDCGIDTILIGEYYMVHHFVWSQSRLGPHDGMLCISCLEKRIDRQLCSEDFSDFPVNTIPFFFRSKLLLQRMNNEL